MKKQILKICSITLFIAVFCILFAIGASADTEAGYAYTVVDGKATIKELLTSETDSITIPSTLGGYPVVSIGNYAFEGWGRLTDVSIPETVTAIGKGAFYGCTGLTSIAIPEGTEEICDYAFYNCIDLISITIPESVASIGEEAFENTAYYDNPDNWEDGLLYCGVHLIRADVSITSCDVKENTKVIASSAFSYCTELQSITIPPSVKSIGIYSFYGCTSLADIAIPASVTKIEKSVFSGCVNLTNITIPEGVTSIDYAAFSRCTSLQSMIIPETVTRIESLAFDGCSNLTIIGYPDTVAQIYAIGHNIPFASLAGDAFYIINSIKVVRISDSAELDAIPTGDFIADLNITNVSSQNKDTIVLASYDKDGAMKSLTYMDLTIDAGKTANMSTLFHNQDGSINSIKAFVWANVSNLKPLGSSAEFTNK